MVEEVKSNVVETIPADKHVLVCGATGTGKSVLAETYLRGYRYVVKLDTKNETDERYRENRSPWEGLTEGEDFTVCRSFEELDDVETDKIIYVPQFEEQTDETFNLFFNWIFERGNTILWIDELMSIGTANRYPVALGRLMTQGRSKGVGVWSCTQRPSSIPAIVPASCHYYFVYTLYLPQDRKRMVETTGMVEMSEIPRDHNFWYYKMGSPKTVKAKLIL